MSDASQPETMSTSSDRRALLQNALQVIDTLQARLDAIERSKTEPIAIIGMSCRFPGGADSPEAYWQLLKEGRDAIRPVPSDRWDVSAYAKPGDEHPPHWFGGFLDGIDQFEPGFFGISPREANTMDPQQRLVLEVSWEALERAGILPENLFDSQTGVFLGITTNDYGRIAMGAGPDGMDVYTATGSAMNVAAGRVAYVLGLHGPTLAVDTACSSSLTAIHLACQSLRNRESQLALAGGVNVLLTPEPFIMFSRWGMMAPDGRCKTFDASADGFVRSEGCGMLVLKRLSDAQTDNDPILALLLSSAVNEDGKSSGLTVPNGIAQQAVIRSALAAAQLKPAQISYVETHGTGTSLGDPIEVEALGAVLGEGRTTPLTIGSVKTNIGHAESASGVAGLIKTVLAMQHDEIPPHLHFKERSPRIPWPKFEVHIPTESTAWPRSSEPRRAGVSSFGFSGVNAHVIIEESPLPLTPVQPAEIQEKGVISLETSQLLLLSARSKLAVNAYAEKMAEYFASHPDTSLADAAHTLATARTRYPHHLAVVSSSITEASEKLSKRSLIPDGKKDGEMRVAFLYTGQGSQYSGMGHELYESQPIFRAALNKCDDILRPLMGASLLEILGYHTPGKSDRFSIDNTIYTQPAIFALEFALSEFWKAWGIEPQAVMGHSVGEYVAACVSGVFSLEDGLRLVAGRGQLIGSLPSGGEMAAVFADLPRVEAAIADYSDRLSVAAINGSENIVISGEGGALQEVVARLAGKGVKSRALNVSHAFHSPLMEPILDEFERLAGSIRMSASRLTLISNVTARPSGAEITRPGYWRQHIRRPVRFAESITTLKELGYTAFVEIGPNPSLLSMAQRCLPESGDLLWLPSLRKGRGDVNTLLTSLGELYNHDMEITWQGGEAAHPTARRISLPTYPFQRERYWTEQAIRPELPPALKTSREWLSAPARIPNSTAVTFTLQVTANFPQFVTDHRIKGTPIFPGAGFLAMAIEAAFLQGYLACYVMNFNIFEALVIPEGKTITLQALLNPHSDGSAKFEIFSLVEDENAGILQSKTAEWKKHASGELAPGGPSVEDQVDLPALQARCNIPVVVKAYYKQLEELGLNYGPSFQGLQEIWRTDQGGEALGKIALAGNLVFDLASYRLHPGMLDACFQVIGAALPEKTQAGDIYMPVGLDNLRLDRPAGQPLYCHVQLDSITSPTAEVLNADLTLLDESGIVCARLKGLHIQRASRQALQRLTRPRFDEWFYELVWQPKSYVQPTHEFTPENWMILADQGGTGQMLADELRHRGASCLIVTLDSNVPEEVFLTAQLEQVKTLSGIVHLWGLDADENDPMAAQKQVCGSVIDLIKALEKTRHSPKLWLVSRHAQPAGDGGRSMSLAQSPLWGLGRTLALEYPNWWGGLVDLDRQVEQTSITMLADQVMASDGEDQVAFRHGQRYVARLAHLTPSQYLSTGQSPAGKDGEAGFMRHETPHELGVSQQGVLDSFVIQSVERVAPGPGEVEVQVFASGLNFRDVLNVLGMYPGEVPLGNECSGVITTVGEGVTELHPGDCVIALGAGTFRSHLITQADLVFAKPDQLSFTEAATVPTAFLTAWYGLHYLANIQPGQRILIHAATGGVGLAAVRLAQRIGLEIFATAGSQTKRRYLHSIGIHHVYNSRTADFAEDILRLTDGNGVDVVLNSLSNEFIPMSLSVLTPHGYFLEIGKRGIWTSAQVAEKYPQVRYHTFDLALEMQNDPVTLQNALREIITALEAGHLVNLPTHTFPLHSASDAFRFMAQAQQIGKIAISHEPYQMPRKDGTYLITGGSGGLGLEVAQSLAENGAGVLILVSRSGPSQAVKEKLTRIEAAGAQVVVKSTDISCKEEVADLIKYVLEELPPLRGIVHAAGITDDALLSQQDWSRFEKVLAPKVAGAWNLHTLTQHLPLEFFVLFSAGAGIFGSAGQSSYAAANVFLDTLANHRRAMGLSGLSINWGAWADVGMAARLGDEHQQRWQALGIQVISPDQGIMAFNQLISMPVPQAAVLPIHWNVLLRALGSSIPLLLHDLVTVAPVLLGKPAAQDEPAWLKSLLNSKPQDQHSLLVELVCTQAAGVLGLKSSQMVDVDQPLTELGLDSLMAVDMTNRLRANLGFPLPSTIAFEYRTINDLVGYLQTEILPKLLDQENGEKAIRPEPSHQPTVMSDDPSQLLHNLDQLSDEDVDRLLRSMDAGKGIL